MHTTTKTIWIKILQVVFSQVTKTCKALFLALNVL